MRTSSPEDELARLLSGFWYTQAIYVAAKLGIADLLREGPRPAAALAQATATDPDALYRLLRALASIGIFSEDAQGAFSLTPLAECLRSDRPDSLRALAIMRGEWQYPAWGEFLYSIQTGRSAFEKLHGLPLFDYLARHPEQGRVFDQAMTGVHGRETDAMLQAYDFSGVQVLADIGGGNGSLLCAVLQRYPALRGILFDQPAVVERARLNVEAAGLSNRCGVVAGDFFKEVPGGADCYLLRHVLHDWEDAEALAILRACRAALAESGKLLVVEGIIPPGNEPSPSKFFDLAMLVVPGGRERTAREYQRLFEGAGFRLSRIVPTGSWISVLECEGVSA